MPLIELTQGRVARVDEEDYPSLVLYSWTWDGNYAQRNQYIGSKKHKIYMHRQILAAPSGVEVDHINRDKLDNRRANLRFATRSQQQINNTSRPRKYSQYRGVIRHRTKWQMQIQLHGEKRSKTFDDEEEAARAYDEIAREWHGEYAQLNFG